MNFSENRRKRKIWIITAFVLLALLMIVAACAIYVGDYYRADQEAIEAFAPMNEVTFRTLEDGTMVFEPENADVGFIFYPGGKVDYTAYQPLMAACAKQGILCVLVKMPFNLAVLDMNAADGIQEKYPEIEDWYIGGHSLGGSMAASYLADHTNDYKGLILLGSYSTADLSETDLEVLSVYGSEDRVLNREKYDENKSNLPPDFKEVVIDGGCHSYFGMYGAQDGDGTPTIGNEEQIHLTVANIVKVTG
ncbi:MAG: alpha/beta hydrolase [Ruminococcaceae bacterium]|nr:alpha/beta hydrolase [Oscillospiraceae bacterium]